jgi:hypothetical protein
MLEITTQNISSLLHERQGQWRGDGAGGGGGGGGGAPPPPPHTRTHTFIQYQLALQ